MPSGDFDIKYVAHLARLSLSHEEEQKLSAQLGNILGFMEKLKSIDVSQVEPTAHAVPMVNVTRADVVQPSLPHDEAMLNAPAKANGLFMVPKIVE
ncbi:MAG TPA: Asp-tRNA(Asn)/Glu-tRNA(Gln) amidotransferase subunit GatC [Verrucomicrobiae bacterium]|nr:Asp-tRNA(Asn)/Glu-tRNA(Gln) amidotransferase subunit GatC [Verrucomicrobiae bacterium]